MNPAIPPNDEENHRAWPDRRFTRWLLLASAVVGVVLLMAAAIGPWSLQDAVEGIATVAMVVILVLTVAAWRTVR